jgi:CheY-like chemotaxis protein
MWVAGTRLVAAGIGSDELIVRRTAGPTQRAVGSAGVRAFLSTDPTSAICRGLLPLQSVRVVLAVEEESVPVDDRPLVLVVDDDPDIRETLHDVLEAEGFAVACAANGREALTALGMGSRPALVILDLMMPTMSGWEVLAAIRADRSLADLPVAVMSAAGPRAAPPGATCFLRKPVDLDTLVELLPGPPERALRRRERLPGATGHLNV